jgi:transposase
MEPPVHAPCWSHPRRQFVDAQRAEPRLVAEALDHSEGVYREEAVIRAQGLEAAAKLAQRGEYTKPLGEAFFVWLTQTGLREVLLPSNPFGHAAQEARGRQAALKVFLTAPEVPIETNQLEREIRPIASGRKNWLFCRTAVGARQVGLIPSLLASGRLQGLDPSVSLVEVLQRVDTPPALEVQLLTPRWGNRPLRSRRYAGPRSPQSITPLPDHPSYTGTSPCLNGSRTSHVIRQGGDHSLLVATTPSSMARELDVSLSSGSVNNADR